MKIPGGGRSPEGEGQRGRKGVCSELGNWGGGLDIFFGAEMSTKLWPRIAEDCHPRKNNYKQKIESRNFGMSLCWITKAKESLRDFVFLHKCGLLLCLCEPNMLITKANAKENLKEFICPSITK